MTRFILDELSEKLDAGRIPASIEARPTTIALIFKDGSEIDLTGEVEFGADADFGKRAALAKLAVKCGWATSTKRAADAMMMFPADYQGELWPAPAEWS